MDLIQSAASEKVEFFLGNAAAHGENPFPSEGAEHARVVGAAGAVQMEGSSGFRSQTAGFFANLGVADFNAVEAVDACVGKLLAVIDELGGTAIITADHGNADCMEENGVPFTAHTTNPVPVILCRESMELKNGALCDIAPTMLDLLGLPVPEEMTGHSLIVKK